MDPTAAQMTEPAASSDAEPSIVEPRRLDFALGGILLGAITVRLLLWLWFRDLPIRIFDENDYDTLARSLVARGEYAFRPGVPTSLRPPLYPAFLAAVYRMFGIGNFAAARLLQAALSLALIGITYRLATELYSRRVGLWAAAFVAFYPSLLGSNNLLLTEVQFTTFLCAGCYALIRAVLLHSRPGLALAGVILGLGALTRSTLWPSFLPFGFWLALAWGGRVGGRLLSVATLLLAFGLTLAPWAIRNTRLEQTFQLVDCMGGRNMMMGNYEYTPYYRAWAAIEIQGEENWFAVLRRSDPDVVHNTQGQLDKVALKYAVNYAREHPGQTALRCLVKFFDFWGLERELISGVGEGFFGPIPKAGILAMAAVIFGSYAAMLFLGLFGMVATPPADWRPHLLLVLAMALICGLHTLTFGHSRYHLPVMPLVIVYAAAAWTGRASIWARRRQFAFLLTCALCAVFVAGWAWSILGPDYKRFLSILGVEA